MHRRSLAAVPLAVATVAGVTTATTAATAGGPPSEATFDAGPEGWVVAELPGPPYDSVVTSFPPIFRPAEGNPGGAIESTDLNGNLFMFAAPPSFLGDRSDDYGASLAVDLFFVDSGLAPGTVHPDIVLHGAGLTLLVDGWDDPLEQTATWETYEVCLHASASWRLDEVDGPVATEQQIRDVLADLTGLYVRGDLWSGAETTRLDNVRIAPRTPDLDGDTVVGFSDVLLLLSGWGPCSGPSDPCLADLDCNGQIDFQDLLAVLSAWTG